jgi:iron complex outermembrane receptor protein
MLMVRRFAAAVSVLAVAIVSPVASTFAQGARQDAVIVRDASGGAVQGAIVVMTHGTTERRLTTPVDGVVRFTGLERGDWIVEVRKEGFEVAAQSVMLGEAPQRIEVTLEPASVVANVVVTAKSSALDNTPTSASRLELSLRELPATLNVVTQDMMQERGASTAMAAIEVAGGTLVTPSLGGQLPGYQARGFANNSILNDGIRQNSSVQSSRPVDSFLLERVEVLKGPASLFAGEGGTAGTVNYVSKTPKHDLGGETLLSTGSFGARRIGVGVTGPLGKQVMARVDTSFSTGGGYAEPSNSKLNASAASLWWTPSAAFVLKTNVKHAADDLDAYYGTPFVNGAIDPRMRFHNYNLADAFSKANNDFARVDAEMELPRGWRLHNGTFAATQRLDYRNMESYAYNPSTGLVDVSGYFLIWRHDRLVGNQTDLRHTFDVFGRSINFIVGAEFQHNVLQRAKNPLNAGTVRYSVDPFDPQPVFDPKLPYLRVPDVVVDNKTAYAEAQARLANRWTAVLGLRWEQIYVNYGLAVGDTATGEKRYYPATGRAGLVYAANDNVSIYGSYSRSVEPATQFVSLSGCCGAATFFGLTPARQYEGGVKGSAWRERLQGTFAYFDIEKRNLPTTTIVNDLSTPQVVGRQLSRGIEGSLSVRPTATLLITGDVAYTHALFADFTEIVNGVNVSRDGNAPTNVPVRVWSITPSQQIGPVTIAGSVRQVGGRWGDTANTRFFPDYTTVDSWVSVRLRKNTRLTLRGRNLTDEEYIVRPSTSYGLVAAPRSVELTLSAGF